MASRAAKAPKDVRRAEVIVSLGGNNAEAAREAASFVTEALTSATAGDQTLAKITLVVGDHAYKPEHSACVGRDVLVSASDADRRNFENASSDAHESLRVKLMEQYAEQVSRVAEDVESAVRSAPPPNENTGAFFIWSFVADAPADRDVHVLGSFTTGGNNCLTLDDPTARRADGRSASLVRVQECVKGHQLEIAPAKSIHLSAVQALDLTGGQKQAQRAVMDALCAAATSGDCRVQGTEQPTR